MHETGKGDYVNRTLMRDLFNRRLGILKLFLSEVISHVNEFASIRHSNSQSMKVFFNKAITNQNIN